MSVSSEFSTALRQARGARVPSESLYRVLGLSQVGFHRWRGSGRPWALPATAEDPRDLLWSLDDALRLGITHRLSAALQLRPAERRKLYDAIGPPLVRKLLRAQQEGKAAFVVLHFRGEAFVVRLCVGGMTDLSGATALVLDAGELARSLVPRLVRAGLEYREKTKRRRKAARVFARSSRPLRQARPGGIEEIEP